MSSIDKMLAEFKDLAELREFSESQHTTIIELTKKIKKLEEEKKHLEQLLVSTVPDLKIQAPVIQINNDHFDYEEIICRMELKKLHDRSLQQALTYEEAKKVDIYTKLLISINSKNKPSETEARKIETGQLLQLVKEPNDGQTE